MKTRNAPTLAAFSAISCLAMMFNVPIPDGTTAHAVGGVVIAICLGPWAAVIALTVGHLLQALLFGDGGVLAFGVNVVNLAVLLPFVGYATYRLIARGSGLTSRRRVVAAAVGGCSRTLGFIVSMVVLTPIGLLAPARPLVRSLTTSWILDRSG